MKTLYSMQGEKIREWSVWSEGSTVVVEHGQLGGKKTQKRYDAEPKNIGRANATTAEQQAEVEVTAKAVKQLKTGYSLSIEEAKSFVPFFPMKAKNFNEQSHKIVYPCIMQAKLNGQRLMIDAQGDAWSKQGEPLELPSHWELVKMLAIEVGGLDGEVYAGLESEGGLSLQEIISAFRKPNENTKKLQYWIYDLPLKKVTMRQRYEGIHEVAVLVHKHEISYIKTIPGLIVDSPERGDLLYDCHVSSGYEGSCYRNLDGEYAFDKRSDDLIKRKPRADAECKPLSFEIDKNGEPVYTVEAVNGHQVGVQFKLKMKKPYRGVETSAEILRSFVKYEYEELSDDNVPTKPVGIEPREVGEDGEGRY